MAWPIAVTEEVRAQSRDAGSPFFQQMNLVSSISVSTAAPLTGSPQEQRCHLEPSGGLQGELVAQMAHRTSYCLCQHKPPPGDPQICVP